VSLFEPSQEPTTEALLRTAIDTVRKAKAMPLSAAVLVSRDELVELLEDAARRLPEEVRNARWMLREREDFLSQTRREAADILEASRVQAEGMVQRSEVVRQSQHAAQRIVEGAQAQSRRLRREAEEYCDHKLATFEEILERTTRSVQAGRSKLHETPAVTVGASVVGVGSGSIPPGEEPEANGTDANGADADGEGFFDQDRR
jgi:cell division septum initiation protein DivIVA